MVGGGTETFSGAKSSCPFASAVALALEKILFVSLTMMYIRYVKVIVPLVTEKGCPQLVV